MNDHIILDMNMGEACFALDAITKAGTNAHRTRRFLMATNAGTDERAIVDLTAEILDRLEMSLRRQMYPEIEESEAVDHNVDVEIERRIERVLDASEYPIDRESDPAWNGALNRW